MVSIAFAQAAAIKVGNHYRELDMPPITKDQIAAAYTLAKDVYHGKTPLTTAIKELENRQGMNYASASDYVNNFAKMMAGEVYQRTLNLEATEYYLENILKDYGPDALAKALEAAEKHVDYYDGLGNAKQVKTRALVEDFKRNHMKNDNNGQLVDLQALGIKCSTTYTDHYKWREIVLSEDFKTGFKKAYEERHENYEDDEEEENLLLEPEDETAAKQTHESIKFGTYSCRITTPTQLYVDFPNQWFEIASYFVEFLVEGNKYHRLAEAISGDLGLTKKEQKKLFASIRDEKSGWRKKLADDNPRLLKKFEDSLKTRLPDEAQRELFLKCITVQGWSYGGKTIDRADYFRSAALKIMKVVHNSQNHIARIADLLSRHPDLLKLLGDEIAAAPDVAEAPRPRTMAAHTKPGINQIVYGAPGSGKSHYLDTETTGSKIIRTVFHPEYQNSDFVGGLKPSVDTGGKITYEFVPGPFTQALIAANRAPGSRVVLIIEEINRANAPAVFGEVFQLLDREDTGLGRYSVTADDTLRSYLSKKGYASGEIRLPANLDIRATMNSSDQGVFLLDSAFKRRWQFHYCPIDFEGHQNNQSFTTPRIPYMGKIYSWTQFAGAINAALRDKHIEEDRLIGPYFLSEAERESQSAGKDAVAGKLLIYLWDDVLRHGLRDSVFLQEIRTFSELVTRYKKGEQIFTGEIGSRLEEAVLHAVEPAHEASKVANA